MATSIERRHSGALDTFRRGLAAWNASGARGQFAVLGYGFGSCFIAADAAGGRYFLRDTVDGPWHELPDVAAPAIEGQPLHAGAVRS